MEVDAFLLCDAATESGVKLNILGAFDTISTKEVPITHPVCAIATRIRCNEDEVGAHSIKVKITDKDGKIIKPAINGSVNFKKAGRSNIVLHITKMTFEQYGKYKFDLMIDNKMEASLPLYIEKLAAKTD